MGGECNSGRRASGLAGRLKAGRVVAHGEYRVRQAHGRVEARRAALGRLSGGPARHVAGRGARAYSLREWPAPQGDGMDLPRMAGEGYSGAVRGVFGGRTDSLRGNAVTDLRPLRSDQLHRFTRPT